MSLSRSSCFPFRSSSFFFQTLSTITLASFTSSRDCPPRSDFSCSIYSSLAESNFDLSLCHSAYDLACSFLSSLILLSKSDLSVLVALSTASFLSTFAYFSLSSTLSCIYYTFNSLSDSISAYILLILSTCTFFTRSSSLPACFSSNLSY